MTRPDERGSDTPSSELSFRALVLVGVVVGGLYALGMGIRGDLVPGLVGGLLAGWLTVIVLREAQKRRARQRR